MFNIGAADSSDFKLGYDMKSKRPFIASKSPKMDSETFKTIVYLDEGLPTFGINEGVKYKATKALNKNKNFNGFMDYLNQRGKGKRYGASPRPSDSSSFLDAAHNAALQRLRRDKAPVVLASLLAATQPVPMLAALAGP